MSGISIITDSTADLGRELVARYGVTVVPLAVVFGQNAYRDGVDIHTKRLFKLVEQNKQLPKTSSPSPDVFRSVFEGILETPAGSVIGSHCGPGTIGILYMLD